ncbi:MAG: hypothetical protein M1816_002832 [Peltula sp. TS41687]|nr:MAG: hypothetical protein M1816_002832 [Peltula sp. TS41687]
MAMQGVTQSLDPGNALFQDWFEMNQKKDEGTEIQGRTLIVDVCGRNSQISPLLAEQFPALTFEVQDVSQTVLDQAQQALSPAVNGRIRFKQRGMFEPQSIEDADRVLAYVMRNLLWNRSDEDCIKLLRTFVPVMEKSPQTVLLVNEMISPARGSFDPLIEAAYRRRDVTVMTMHNAKQRTEEEWRELFKEASPHFKVGGNSSPFLSTPC